MRRGDAMFENIDDLSGLSRTHPVIAFCLAMMMFSLAGIPPLAGFFAKFYVFAAAIKANLVTLAVIGVVTSVVGAYYYLRIVKVMYFDEPRERYEPMPPASSSCSRLSSAVVLPLLDRSGPARRSRPARGRALAVLTCGSSAPRSQAAGYRLLSLDATGSTNDDAFGARPRGRSGPALDRRRASSGRAGGGTARQWSSPPGNLYASLLLIDPVRAGDRAAARFRRRPRPARGRRGTSTGIGAPRLALKWPNDLLLDGAKVAGLLLEGHRIAPDGSLAIVIGFGVNVASRAAGTPYPATTLRTVEAATRRARACFAALSRLLSPDVFAAWRAARRARRRPIRSAPIRRLLARAGGRHRRRGRRSGCPRASGAASSKVSTAHGRLQLEDRLPGWN